ncbi:hypothetical protein Tco_0649701 [Tanacetum coccineum]
MARSGTDLKMAKLNLVPPPGVEGRKGLVIREPESEVKEMFAKLELTIDVREDVAEARIIIKDNLDGLGQHMLSNERPADRHQRVLKDSLTAKPQQATSDKEYTEVLRRVRGGNTLTILLPFEEEQAELKIPNVAESSGNVVSANADGVSGGNSVRQSFMGDEVGIPMYAISGPVFEHVHANVDHSSDLVVVLSCESALLRSNV